MWKYIANRIAACFIVWGMTCTTIVVAEDKIQQLSFEAFINRPIPSDVSFLVNESSVIMVSSKDGHTLYMVETPFTHSKEKRPNSAVTNIWEYWAQFWYPLYADSKASPVGDWNIIDAVRGGGKQWSYAGIPVMTYRQDLRPGDVSGPPLRAQGGIKDTIYTMIKPLPKPEVSLPPGFSVQRIEKEWVVVDANEHPLYQLALDRLDFHCDENCRKSWLAVRAPLVGRGIANWTVIRGPDGVPQWAYQGSPVYRSASEGDPDGIAENTEGWVLITVPDVKFTISEDKILPEKIANR